MGNEKNSMSDAPTKQTIQQIRLAGFVAISPPLPTAKIVWRNEKSVENEHIEIELPAARVVG